MPSRFDRTREKTERARRLRRPLTPAELRLWGFLRRGALGTSFRKQHPLGPYILDFYCPALKLAIELDGSQHRAQADYDDRRTAFLAERGVLMLRFWNNQVFEETDGAGRIIIDAIQTRRMQMAVDS